MFDRIVVLAPSLTSKDGISVASHLVVSGLMAHSSNSARLFECWCLSEPKEYESRQQHGIQFRSARQNKVQFASWGIQAGLKQCKRTLVVVLHLHFAPIALPLFARGAHVAVFLHGIEAWEHLSMLRKAALLKTWRLIGNSSYTISRFQSANPDCKSLDTTVCHLGIPLRPATPAREKQAGRFALIVGRLAANERYKGHDQLLEMWPGVVSEQPTASLVITGDGDDRQRLQEKTCALGLENSVTFLGRVSDEALAALYRDCEFFVMPSPNEGFGLVFLEAMRAGKACIGATGAASEIIVDGVTGIIVNPANPRQILREVLRLFRTPELRERMGRAGAERFASHFTDEHFLMRLRTTLMLDSEPHVSAIRMQVGNSKRN